MRCCSLDGDADRLLYYTFINDNIQKEKDNIQKEKDNIQKEKEKDNDDEIKLSVLEGDKILLLYLKVILLLAPAEIEIGLVQTAYANGAST